MIRKIIMALLVLGGLLFGQFGLAAGVGVKPPRLEFAGAPLTAIARDVLLFNSENAPAIYLLSIDRNENRFQIEPKEIALGPGEQKLVRIFFRPRLIGRFETSLSIVARSVDAGEFSASAGVKVPIKAESAFSKNQLAFLLCLLFLIVVLLYIILKEQILRLCQKQQK